MNKRFDRYLVVCFEAFSSFCSFNPPIYLWGIWG